MLVYKEFVGILIKLAKLCLCCWGKVPFMSYIGSDYIRLDLEVVFFQKNYSGIPHLRQCILKNKTLKFLKVSVLSKIRV